MHPTSRKGPLFYKTPPFSTFYKKNTFPHFISCLRPVVFGVGNIADIGPKHYTLTVYSTICTNNMASASISNFGTVEVIPCMAQKSPNT